MSLLNCKIDGQPALKWGANGKPYSYNPNVPGSFDMARNNAIAHAKQPLTQNIQRLTLQTTIQHMDHNDIMNMVDPTMLDEIKARDPHPIIRVYGVGEEGISSGKLIGVGHRIIHYLQHAISKLHEQMKVGVPVFHGHASTNDNTGRLSIGKVVGRSLTKVGEKAKALAAIYLFPEYSQADLDIASIEASAIIDPNPDGTFSLNAFKELTGIALSNSKVDNPGIPGSTLLASVQAFAAKTTQKNGDKPMPMDIEEIKTAIKEGKFAPSDLFTEENLAGDFAVRGIVRSKTDKIQGFADRKSEEIDKLREATDKRIKEADEKAAKLENASWLTKTSTLLEDMTKGRNLNEKQTNFIKGRVGQFKTEASDETAVKQDLNLWMDNEVKEFDKLATLFGVQEPQPNTISNQPQIPFGGNPAPPNINPGQPPPKTGDMSDPRNNDLIPVG